MLTTILCQSVPCQLPNEDTAGCERPLCGGEFGVATACSWPGTAQLFVPNSPFAEHVNNPPYRAHNRVVSSASVDERNTGLGSRWRFPVYFPRNSPVCRYAHCGMLSAMKSGLRDFERSFHSGFAVDGKLNDSPSSTIQSGRNSAICRVSRVPGIGLTVKLRNRTRRQILPSVLPSKSFAGSDRCR